MFRRNREAKRHAALFVDKAGTCAIAVPMHYNGPGGFLFEDDSPQVMRPLPEAAALGPAVFSALEKSQVRPQASHYKAKPAEWPSFKSSGVRSIRQFEADFIRIHIDSNGENVGCAIEGFPDKDSTLRVSSYANPRLLEELGERCLAVWRACRDRVL